MKTFITIFLILTFSIIGVMVYAVKSTPVPKESVYAVDSLNVYVINNETGKIRAIAKF